MVKIKVSDKVALDFLREIKESARDDQAIQERLTAEEDKNVELSAQIKTLQANLQAAKDDVERYRISRDRYMQEVQTLKLDVGALTNQKNSLQDTVSKLQKQTTKEEVKK
jgi:chromosome segregation ATPase